MRLDYFKLIYDANLDSLMRKSNNAVVLHQLFNYGHLDTIKIIKFYQFNFFQHKLRVFKIVSGSCKR